MSDQRGDRRAMVVVALAVLALHTLIAASLDMPGVFSKYSTAAELLLAGQLATERLVDFSPLYLQLSVAAERLTAAPERVLVGLQIVLTAIAAALFFDLLRRRFGSGWAAVAVAVLACDRHLLIYQRILEPEICLFFFLIGMLYSVESDHRLAPLAAGALAAASLATRPNLLPLVLLIPLYLRLRDGATSAWLARSALVAVPVVAMLTLLALRAVAVTGDARTPMMNPGTVFYEGNQPLSRGTSATYPPIVLELTQHSGELPDSAHQHYRDVARADSGSQLTIAEVNAFWSRKASAFLRAEPRRWLRLVLEKLHRVFHGYRAHDVPTAWHYDRALGTPTFPFALLSALALVGLLLAARQWPASLLYYGLAAVQIGVMLVFYVSARQRLALLPALLYFALIALRSLAGQTRWRAVATLAMVAGLATSFVLPTAAMRDEIHQQRSFDHSDALFQEVRRQLAQAPAGDLPLASLREDVLAAFTVAPAARWHIRPAFFPQEEASFEEQLRDRLAARHDLAAATRFDLAVLELEAGDLDAAEVRLNELVAAGIELYRRARQPSDPRFYLSRIAARRGDEERAVELLEACLVDTPGDPFVLAELLALTDEPAYIATLEAYTSRLDAQYLIGRALSFHRRHAEAAAAFGFVVRRLPAFREAHLHHAAALAAAGRDEEAVWQYRTAVEQRLEPVLLSGAFVPLFERWAEVHHQQPEALFFAARVLHQHGHFSKALRWLAEHPAPPTVQDAWKEETRRLRLALAAQGTLTSPLWPL